MKNPGIISTAMLAWIATGVLFSCSGFGGCWLIQLLTGSTLEGLRGLDPEFHNMLRLASSGSWFSLPGSIVSCCPLFAVRNWRGDRPSLQVATAGLLIGVADVIWRSQIEVAILTF